MPKNSVEIPLLDDMFYMNEHFIAVQIFTLLDVQIIWVSVCILCFLINIIYQCKLYLRCNSLYIMLSTYSYYVNKIVFGGYHTANFHTTIVVYRDGSFNFHNSHL